MKKGGDQRLGRNWAGHSNETESNARLSPEDSQISDAPLLPPKFEWLVYSPALSALKQKFEGDNHIQNNGYTLKKVLILYWKSERSGK